MTVVQMTVVMEMMDRDDAVAARAALADRVFDLRIGGAAVDADRERYGAIDPSTEQELTTFPLATESDLDHAVEVAAKAGRTWGRLHWLDRARAMRALADELEKHADELGLLDTLDAGLPIRTAVKDVHDAARSLRYFAGLGGEVVGRAQPWTPGSPFIHTSREPYGVVGKIVPFNHPVKFAAVKSAAALIAGNSIIVKPSEFSSLSALRLAEIADSVLPPGVFTVLPGRGDIGAGIAAHPGIPRISFTGSVAVGAMVMKGAADEIKQVSMELGGKNPMLVLEDADPVEAAQAAVNSLDLFRSPGQACWSTSRVLLHESLREPFFAELQRFMATITVGDPMDPGTDMGPLAYGGHYERVLGLVESGREEGARVLIGGGRPAGFDRGYYLEPTVFVDVDPGMRIASEEIFGPVLSVLTWSDLDEAIGIANSLPLGLTAAIWTGDLARGHSLAREIEAGVVWINTASARPVGTPFGGYKRSGVGREGNLEDVLGYTQEKAVITATVPIREQ
jgi:betaine-aldehyde dehydrogenase